ncbi:nuclear transport factor 2 family protein [Ktedonosporobacter rubrisoli]|uniref:Nuclear transport factor 2 family protein n=1 Tax=Ktedonosporobacter rubrisoli TaxID=2509675 RepID=A0A4P6JLL6_KTERU|nr:nuclear transport factor 2 family protein [Ktedonosporobacter rubrisoli]QBD75556.1 nuclear transport factor 2 family protein [Ktedonosporobacter rubrisoli]
MTAYTPDFSDYGRLAYDRIEVADALYRWAAGLDLGDADLLASSCTEDICFDFAPAASKIGIEFPALSSRDVVVKTMIAVIGPLDTSHAPSNLRITVNGESAGLQAYVLAQHFSPGEGPRPDRTRHALLMGRYDANLVRDAEIWRISRLTIDCIWFEGDPTVVTAQLSAN